jgi:hypothetical protein
MITRGPNQVDGTNFDLMFDAHIRDGHLHKAEPFFDAFHPFIFAERSESLRDGLVQ